ncbi:hypothetical protein Taro_049819 [Colocasia esculenta]|uniref:Uncharacterized protein n=1 Tax=Colocasia esculenta TaxID=4460 RepID=A0A843XBW1_COLES|nr:hypothetical protein [Colocasia esculenta]
MSSSVGSVGLALWAVFSGFCSAGSLVVSCVVTRLLVCKPFLGVVCGGTRVCSSLTSWHVRGAEWFFLWALDLVEVCGSRACGKMVLLTWLLGVSRGDTLLFLPDLVEVWDVGAYVVRLWSHVVAPVFRELLCLGVVLGPTLVVGRGNSLFHCFVGLFEFIAYLPGLNSNTSGSSDQWVAVRLLGSLAGVREVGSLQGSKTKGGYLHKDYDEDDEKAFGKQDETHEENPLEGEPPEEQHSQDQIPQGEDALGPSTIINVRLPTTISPLISSSSSPNPSLSPPGLKIRSVSDDLAAPRLRSLHSPFPNAILNFLLQMAPKTKILTRRRRASTDAGESSTAPSDHRSKHHEDRLPELIVPQGLHLIWVHGTFKKLVQSRSGRSFFYGERHSFRLTANRISTSLQIPNSGVEIFNYAPSASEYYELVTLQPYDSTTKIARSNANSFPPLIWMIHHIFTTLIVPKDGSRELVTEVHKSLFIFFLKCQQINLPELMLSLIRRCISNTKRSMPYACPITSLLILIGIPIPSSEPVSLKSRSAFDLTAAHRMGYKFVDGVVTRTLKGKEQQGVEESYDEEDNEDNEDNEESDEEPQDEQMPDQPQEFGDVPMPQEQSLRDYLAQLHQQMTSEFAQLNTRFASTDDLSLDVSHVHIQDRLEYLYSERAGSRHPPPTGHDDE